MQPLISLFIKKIKKTYYLIVNRSFFDIFSFILCLFGILIGLTTITILSIRLKKNNEGKDKRVILAAISSQFLLIIILFSQMLDSVSFNF